MKILKSLCAATAVVSILLSSSGCSSDSATGGINSATINNIKEGSAALEAGSDSTANAQAVYDAALLADAATTSVDLTGADLGGSGGTTVANVSINLMVTDPGSLAADEIMDSVAQADITFSSDHVMAGDAGQTHTIKSGSSFGIDLETNVTVNPPDIVANDLITARIDVKAKMSIGPDELTIETRDASSNLLYTTKITADYAVKYRWTLDADSSQLTVGAAWDGTTTPIEVVSITGSQTAVVTDAQGNVTTMTMAINADQSVTISVDGLTIGPMSLNSALGNYGFQSLPAEVDILPSSNVNALSTDVVEEIIAINAAG